MEKEYLEQLGNRILKAARNELYLKMKYMDVAFSRLHFELDMSAEKIGTDGENIRYHPVWLMDTYQRNRREINRAYLHMVLHCLFGHLFTRGKREKEFWDIACNIAVESIIDSLSYPCVRKAPSWLRQETYRKLKKETNVFTAQKIYHCLISWGMTEQERLRLAQEFAADDHAYWPQPDENNKKNQELEESWKQTSEQMELNMDTFAQEQAQSSGKLMEQLKIAHRKRYDYREFLRKFSVWKEEIRVDDDSFDYAFYSYGLSLYGNMPLIEPQETKEVKKIEEFVSVIDTSLSCSGELVKKFLEETYDVLSENDSFFRKVHIHIIQCDEEIREDVKIETAEELKSYMDCLELRGGGGTDFRPAFTYIQELMEKQTFQNLRGVLYFTDGYGIFPTRMPPFQTAFIFMDESGNEISVPPWAVKLVLEESVFMESEEEEGAY